MSHPALRVDSRGERLRLLHVHAHPDDESSKGAATTAKYVAEGVDVVVATCTGGERGSILNPSMDRADILANIAEVRRQEMDRARAILGVEQVWLGFVDSGLPEGDPLPPLPEGSFATLDPEIAVLPLIKIIREFQPHVITTYDENGGYPHPDHIMCHKISVAAFDLAADPDVHPELGTAWQASKLYYSFTFHRAKFAALDQAMTERGLESPYTERLKEWPDDPEQAARITTRVECAAYYHLRDQALLAHATQVDPEGPWFSIPLEVHKRAWPTEDYQLARCLVDSEIPEDDLFAGVAVRPGVESEHVPPRPRPECGQAGLDRADHHDSAGGRPGAALSEHAATVPQDQRSPATRPMSSSPTSSRPTTAVGRHAGGFGLAVRQAPERPPRG